MTTKNSELEAAKQIDKNRGKSKKRKTLYDYVDRYDKVKSSSTVKTMIDFDEEFSDSIKAVAI